MIKGISNNSAFISTISQKKDEQIKQNNEVEKSKTDSIKEAIKNGTYKIDINKTASKMAEALL